MLGGETPSLKLQNTHGGRQGDERQDATVEALMEHLIARGPEDITTVFARVFGLAAD